MVANLAKPLKNRLAHSVDILIFNPPYVPTTFEEVDIAQSRANIQGSWAGGNLGMHITDVFLQDVEVLKVFKAIFLLHIHS